jgi:hypothetical protein
MENEIREMFMKTIREEDDAIFIKPLCDFFKIDFKNQCEVIRRDPILARLGGKKTSKTLFGDNHVRIWLPKKGFIRWIQKINPSTVTPHLRSLLLIYQELVFDYLYGAAEEQRLIGSLNTEIQAMQMEYSRLGNGIKLRRRQLTDLLDRRYQYSLPFDGQKQLNL